MAEDSNTVIAARGLTRRFGVFVAVSDVDLGVQRGEVFGLLGANGAGKTTVIRMLCGTLAPSRGEIRVAGIDMVRTARSARGRIGYVAQRFALYGDLTVLENLKLQAGLYNLRGEHARSRLGWALDHLDLKSEQNTRAGELPLGFQRRLAVAAALLHEPDVLFLDEPTSGIDPLARQQFWELVYELAESGIGVLVTTHYMDEALFCDRLALMHAGRIVAEGAPEDLLARPLATPILELRTSAGGDWVRWLAEWPEIREVIPHAGRLRVRLRAAIPSADFIGKIRQEALRRGIPMETVEMAAPGLEDVFVAVLEEQAAA
ncbi:MAG: ABC transporter ATP-binding protein [Burkholderiales bacterium]